MAATRTSTKKTSRERARARRAELDAARAERDAAIEAAAASFFDADDFRAELAERIRRIYTECAAAVATLVELKEPNSRIAALLDITAAEVRRLRELVEDTPASDAPATVNDTTSTASDTESEFGDGAAGAETSTSQWAPSYASAS